METIWDLKLQKTASGSYRVVAVGPEGKRVAQGDTPETAFAQCVAGFVYKPAFGPNWQYERHAARNEAERASGRRNGE